MKKELLIFIFFALFGANLFAQENKQVGTWRLITQKVTLPDGRMGFSDSSNHIQIKILTPDHYMVMSEAIINGQKRFLSFSGGHYTLVGNEYVEKIEYASYAGYDSIRTKFTLRVDGDKLFQDGELINGDGSKTIFDEVYERDK